MNLIEDKKIAILSSSFYEYKRFCFELMTPLRAAKYNNSTGKLKVEGKVLYFVNGLESVRGMLFDNFCVLGGAYAIPDYADIIERFTQTDVILIETTEI